MKKELYYCLSAMILSLAPGALLAQDYEYHRALSDRFYASFGAFRSSNAFKARAEGGEIYDNLPGDDIDFGNALDVSTDNTLFDLVVSWKFGKTKKWVLAGQYFNNDATGEKMLTEDVEWDGVTFREGSFVGAGVEFAVARVFIGRSFIKNDRNDFGVGIGLHDIEMSLFMEGEVEIDNETTDFQRVEVGDNQPLPNIGAWYLFSPAGKWLLHGRVDWISASIGDYDGTLWNVNAGVNYQAFRHVGFGLSWQYFNLNFNVDKSNWRGGVDLTYSGPVLAVTANW
jgi:hypothetical protein